MFLLTGDKPMDPGTPSPDPALDQPDPSCFFGRKYTGSQRLFEPIAFFVVRLTKGSGLAANLRPTPFAN